MLVYEPVNNYTSNNDIHHLNCNSKIQWVIKNRCYIYCLHLLTVFLHRYNWNPKQLTQLLVDLNI